MVVTCSTCLEDVLIYIDDIYYDGLEGYMTTCPECNSEIILTDIDLSDLTKKQLKEIRSKKFSDNEEDDYELSEA